MVTRRNDKKIFVSLSELYHQSVLLKLRDILGIKDMDQSTDKESLIKSAIRRFSSAIRPLSGKVANFDKKEDCDHLICRPEDNPNYILKACGRGQIEVVTLIIDKDPSKVSSAKDANGWTCMHHAARSNRVQIIDILLSFGADINALDNDDNTPLHLATAKGHLDTVRHLLTKKAKGNILNKKNMGAIHIAAWENKPYIITEMRKFPDQVDFCLVGVKGCLALHFAAKYDYDECAKELIKSGGALCLPSALGLTPLHIAAKHGSAKTMEIILSHGESLGISRQQLLTKGDKEGNSPLHTSVSSGDLNAVRICLEHGSEIDFCLESKSTPLHFACSQGILPIVKLMFETHVKRRGLDEAQEVLGTKDQTRMTPLHRAALFDHAPVVQYLIEQGANVNDLDIDQRTPLLLAAYKKSIKSMFVLLEAGADVEAKDVYQRNLLHYLVAKQIIGTCRMVDDQMTKIWQSPIGARLVNEKDLKGWSPLHYSSKDGNLKFTEDLINLGATINLKNNEDQSPLHFAAKYGRYKTARRLLESQIGLHIINEVDQDGMTALHLASANGRTKVVQMLCEKGALIHKNYTGQCPAHLAAVNGFKDTLNILLSFHPNLIDELCYRNFTALHVAATANKGAVVELLLNLGSKNVENDDGRKPLDMAIENGCVEAALVFVMHDRWIEFLTAKSKLYVCPLKGFIQLMPEVYKVVLDRCHKRASNIDEQSPAYWEKFNFNLIQPKIEDVNLEHSLCAQNLMVKYGRVELLNHPVCLNYLKMKWRAYGFPIFLFNFSLYTTFVLLFTAVLIQNQHSIMERADNSNQAYGYSLATNETNKTDHGEPRMFCMVNVYFMLAFLILNIIKEVIEMWQQKFNYAFDFNNYTEWLLYITTSVYIVPIIMMNPIHIEYIQCQCGSLAIFLAWFNLLMHLEKVESVGIYIIMFQRILKTILKVILIFSVLFIAFALTFFVLMQNDIQGGFRSPFLSFVHVIMLMMGDWNFVDLYQKPFLQFSGTGILRYPELNFFFLILFVILIPILFINLLIGLAVGDIEIVRSDAMLKKLAMQVEYHTKLELKLPKKFLAKIDKNEILIYPNRILQQAGICSNMVDRVRVFFFGAKVPNCPNRNRDLKMGHLEKDTEISIQTKRKFNEIQSQLNQITDLLRMVVQKMDIGQETDHNDINI